MTPPILQFYRWHLAPEEHRQLSRVGEADTVVFVSHKFLAQIEDMAVEEFIFSDEVYINWQGIVDRHYLANGDQVIIFKDDK